MKGCVNNEFIKQSQTIEIFELWDEMAYQINDNNIFNHFIVKCKQHINIDLSAAVSSWNDVLRYVIVNRELRIILKN